MEKMITEYGQFVYKRQRKQDGESAVPTLSNQINMVDLFGSTRGLETSTKTQQ
jgi:hypothetical protein